jgi:hypothetical protein
MDNYLEEKGLESFISNEPRTAYNLAKFLLTPKNISHKIPTSDISKAEIVPTSEVERFIHSVWKREDARNRSRGRGSWLGELVSHMLAYGWYSVFAAADNNSLMAEIWSPNEVYPRYDDELGLIEVVHAYKTFRSSVLAKAKRRGWDINWQLPPRVQIYDYWITDGEVVYNSIIVDNKFVKPLTPHPELPRIPVFVGPVGGLPDRGSLMPDDVWRETIGQPLIAVNEHVIRNYNRQHTFLQQLLRDTAQAKMFEKTSGGPIIQPEDVNKRGAIFRMSPTDDVGYIQPPPVPVEIRTQLFDISSMIQRGSFPYQLYGNIQGQMAGYMMSQIAAAAQQVLHPYKEAVESVLTDIDNFWLTMLHTQNLSVYGWSIPPGFPPEAKFSVEYDIKIPGDAAARATIARMLNPNFRLSVSTIFDILYPEVKDPILETAKANRDEAMQHPLALGLSLSLAYAEQAEIYRLMGDEETAMKFERLAQAVDSQLANTPLLTRPSPTSLPSAPSLEQEILPRESISSPEGALR